MAAGFRLLRTQLASKTLKTYTVSLIRETRIPWKCQTMTWKRCIQIIPRNKQSVTSLQILKVLRQPVCGQLQILIVGVPASYLSD